MQIKNLMSEDLITVDKDQNLSDALKLLRKHNVSRLPVTNNKELVGIISERDIANKLGSSKYESMPASRLHISSVMVKDVFTVPKEMQLEDVAKLMLDNGIGSVPVMDDEKILSISDTICIFAAHGDNNHHMPNIDIVEIGINLKSGLGIVITSFGSRGQTQIYNLMLTILQSLIDASEIETWLQETWIPYITEF